MLVKQDVVDSVKKQEAIIQDKLDALKIQSAKDLEIDDIDLDITLINIPKLQSKYINMYSDEVCILKDLYALKEKVKLERWKYWSGKQTDRYYAENGMVHEKVLKTDIDKYLAADDKIMLVNNLVTLQKTLVDHIEKVLKEVGNMSFHIKSAIDWRKFCSGGN